MSLSWLSSWSVIKAAGFTSLVFLACSLIIGIFAYSTQAHPKRKAVLIVIHQASGWISLWSGLLHGVVLTIDQYEPFSIQAVFLPFSASYEPLASGLGTIGFYLLLIVILTSDFMKRVGKIVWKNLHYLSYLAMLISIVHGFLIGSDSTKPWAFYLYLTLFSLFVSLLFFRLNFIWSMRRSKSPSLSKK